MSKTNLLSLLVLLLLVVIIIFKQSNSDKEKPVVQLGDTILAFGDSLTNGFGANPAFSYPSLMEKKTGINIINAGVNGELSSAGLRRLEKFLEHKPALVILCHGGNDIIQKKEDFGLKENLIKMIALIREGGAKVLLVGVPDFNLFALSPHDIYDEVANETGVIYEDEVLSKIMEKRSLKSDYVHPNAKGYEMMADAFIDILHLETKE